MSKLKLTATIDCPDKYHDRVFRSFNFFVQGWPERVGDLKVIECGSEAVADDEASETLSDPGDGNAEQVSQSDGTDAVQNQGTGAGDDGQGNEGIEAGEAGLSEGTATGQDPA